MWEKILIEGGLHRRPHSIPLSITIQNKGINLVLVLESMYEILQISNQNQKYNQFVFLNYIGLNIDFG